MVLQLAEKFHNKPGLSDKLLANRPEANVRPKSVELVSLLKTGNMDYAWEYKSVAIQHELKYVEADEHINPGQLQVRPVLRPGHGPGDRQRTGYLDHPHRAVEHLRHHSFENAPNRDGGVLFLEYLLDPAGGLKILEDGTARDQSQPGVHGSSAKALPGKLPGLVEVQQ